MNDIYAVDKNVEKIITGKYTYFLDNKLQNLVKRKINKIEYNIYKPYKDSEKVIFYQGNKPNVLLYKIICKKNIKHQDILGALFNLGIDPSMYGDIIIIDNNYYIYILDIIENYLINNLLMIGKNKINFEKQDINILKDYERKSENIELIVSSDRIDTVISSLIHSNRDIINNKIKNKEILINYEIPKKCNKLKKDDIISIRKYGKYQYMGIINTTKKNHYIISINKYI